MDLHNAMRRRKAWVGGWQECVRARFQQSARPVEPGDARDGFDACYARYRDQSADVPTEKDAHTACPKLV